MGTRGGVSSNKVKECDFGLGLRMQPKDSCIVMSHQSEPSQLSSSSCCSSSSSSLSGGGDGGRPMFYSRSNRDTCFGDIYDVFGAGSASENKSLQFSSFASNSSGEISQPMNTGVPFTVAQWQELERQNMICRYLGASVPVPPELLVPILRTQSNTSSVGKGSLEFGISGCNSDPEPWRCKRTDGKKWRCSRDVAPDQKYCERHSHKSRPRSRKPVELHSESMASYTSNYTNVLNQKSQFRSQPNSNFSLVSSTSMVSLPSFYDQQPRSLDWFLKGETVPVASSNSNSSQEWHLMKTESTKSDEKMHSFRGQLESNSYMDLRGGGQSLQTHRLNDNCSLLLSPKAASLTPSSSCSSKQAQETRHFLDVWSSAMRDSGNVCGLGNDCSVPSSEKTLSLPSSLSLSMAGGCEEIENGEASSFGIIGGSDKEGGCVMRPPGQWMSHGSWLGSTPGGPLAEALCLGISSSAKDDSSHGNTSGIDNKP